MGLKEKYGSRALVAGASEGIGAAFSECLAAAGLDLVLIARRPEPLEALAARLRTDYTVRVECLAMDLADPLTAGQIHETASIEPVDILVYNAAISHIGKFEEKVPEDYARLIQANVTTPANLFRLFGEDMLQRGRGALIMMASLAGFQGSGFISAYAATKAFDQVLAESLWYEWKDRGVDVIACCAGATATPNYIASNPEKSGFFAPRVQLPHEIAEECFRKLGKTPSFVTGRGNKVATFIMRRLMPRKMAVKIMGDTTRKIYRID